MDFNAIRKLAIDAGFNQRDAEVAAAIALAESGGNPSAHNSNAATKDDSYGLWQINYYGDLRASRTQRFGPPQGLLDPKKNAAAAFQIFKDSGFNAWTTFKDGKYKSHLLDGSAPAQVAGATQDAASGVSSAVTAVPDAINAFGKTLFTAVANFNGVIIAVVLLVLGIVLLLHKQIGGVIGAAKKVKKIV